MIEKRFTRIICSNDEYTGSLYCNDEPLKIDTVCDLLNKLNDENKELKKDINALINNIQDSAKMSADIICKPMNKRIWGDSE